MVLPTVGPRVLRGSLQTVDPAGKPLRTIAFQFNPDTLTRNLRRRGGQQETDPADAYRVHGAPIETLTLTVELDATDAFPGERFPDIARQLAELELLLYPTSDSVAANDQLLEQGTIEILGEEAPLLLLSWGRGARSRCGWRACKSPSRRSTVAVPGARERRAVAAGALLRRPVAQGPGPDQVPDLSQGTRAGVDRDARIGTQQSHAGEGGPAMTGRYTRCQTAVLATDPALASRPGAGDDVGVAYLLPRAVPMTPPTLLARHRVEPGDRLDLLAAHYIGDPDAAWRIADANTALDPDELVGPDAVDRSLLVPAPQPGG